MPDTELTLLRKLAQAVLLLDRDDRPDGVWISDASAEALDDALNHWIAFMDQQQQGGSEDQA